MKKLLLLSAIALCSGAVMAQTTTQCKVATAGGGWSATIVSGPGAAITLGSSQYTYQDIVKDQAGPGTLSVTCSEANNVQFQVEDNEGNKTWPQITVGEPTVISLEDGKTYEVQIQTPAAGGGSFTVSAATLDDVAIATFPSKSWDASVAPSFAATVDFTSNWQPINIVDADGNELFYDVETEGKWEFVLTLEEASPVEDLYFNFAAAANNENSRYSFPHFLKGETTHTFKIDPDDEYTKAKENLKGLQLQVADKGYGAIKIKSIALTKFAKATALKPALENAELVGTEYFSLTGVKSATPQKGINIIRRSFSNGSVQVEKALIK